MADHARGLTYDEWIAAYGPEFERMEAAIRPCIAGLIKHGVLLAAEGKSSKVTELREMVDIMAGFWFPDEESRIVAEFDAALSTAKDSKSSLRLSLDEKIAVLNGLEICSQQMAEDLDNDRIYQKYDELAAQLQKLWSEPPLQIRYEGDGKFYSLGEWWKLVEPEFRHKEAVVKQGIPSLVSYAATLAAEGMEDRLTWFRELYKYMTLYWYPQEALAALDTESDTNEKTAEECLKELDDAIAAAKGGAAVPHLSSQEMQSAIASVGMHVRVLQEDDPIPAIPEYQKLHAELRDEWIEQDVAREREMTFG